MFKTLFTSFSIFALGLGSVLAEPFSNETISDDAICGFSISALPSDDLVAEAEAHFQANKQPLNTRAEYAATIEVYWHVIRAGDRLDQGNILDSQINASIAVIDSHYKDAGMTFVLTGTDRTTNPAWFNDEPGAANRMKGSLHRGGAATLNIYSMLIGKSTVLGLSTMPKQSAGRKDDGVMIRYTTVPGGSRRGSNDGKTLTHEVGHWLGLYHTFQGYCKGDGDYVDDTPPEAYGSGGCRAGKDTCPGGGVDPIHNHMDYSSSYCRTEFTPGQLIRMKEQIALYRGIKG
ncbi:hypothetical protein FRC08_001032 [Ceratobasidium sp. 394]|nr:hypothetical protein FRC08_001032 [Ceratobasidium sp. 394]